MQKLIIGTRKSKLAIWQSEYIKAQLNKYYPNMDIELKKFSTRADRMIDVPLVKIGGKGLFTEELETALLNKKVNLAVHSLKDVPTQFEKGLKLAAVAKRFDSRDAFLSQNYSSFETLPEGSIVGTTSLRRRMQIKMLRKNIKCKNLRGNITTRIEKLKKGEYDAIILAATGLQKLKIENEVKYFVPLSIHEMIPSMGQGTLAIETLDKKEIIDIVKVLNDDNAHIESTIERSFVHTLEGGCQVPIGVKATIMEDKKSIKIDAIVGMPDASEYIKDSIVVKMDDYIIAGVKFAQKFIKKGAKELLAKASRAAFEEIA